MTALLVGVGIVALWLVDVGQLAARQSLPLTNTLVTLQGDQVYHIGLYLAVVVVLIFGWRGRHG